ncbi:MAG TPA: hypothetical protein VGP51_01495 [Nocardioidaceae bacterium]|nr:hypothetical protein [Nocardioidaceae bacterium]
MLFAIQVGWWVGWTVGTVVVVIAALLLLAIIGLGRRIIRQAQDITGALDSTRTNTNSMFDLSRTNLALDRTVRSLARAREERR